MANGVSHAFPQPSKVASNGTSSNKVDAVHVVIRSGAALNQIFTYFPYPDIPLIRWRAKPGPTRIVDAPWTISPGYRFITNEGSHIPGR